ncbi:hypothetical protein IQ258_19770, partial [Coleofasciculus sp. LEGE 07081]
MLGRIWQWLKGLFRRLFGVGTSSPHPERYRENQERQEVETPPPLADSDYEYLFRQLLEGVTHGWQQERVLKFFESLNGRVTNAQWVSWLERYGESVLASKASNHELARPMVKLGEMTQFIPSVRDIGEAAYSIGSQVLTREHTGAVWEYEGPDANPRTPQPTPHPEGEVPQGEAITLDELFDRLQKDANLRQLITQQLGIDSTDPQVI